MVQNIEISLSINHNSTLKLRHGCVLYTQARDTKKRLPTNTGQVNLVMDHLLGGEGSQ